MSLNIDQAIRTVMQQDASLVEILHGPAVEVVSSLLRSMLVSAKGMSLWLQIIPQSKQESLLG